MNEKWVSRIVVVVACVVAFWALTAKQNADRETIIALENEAAAKDTLRVLRVGKDGQRLAFVVALQQAQVTLRSAEARLAKAEKIQAKLVADLAVAVKGIDTVYTTLPATVGSDSGSLRDSLTLTGPPITGTITADLSALRPSVWGVNLQPDPIKMVVVVGCRKVGPPSIVVTAPKWSTVIPTNGTLDPNLCHSRPQKARWPWFLAGVGVGLLGWEALR